jgi:hypothetical protein
MILLQNGAKTNNTRRVLPDGPLDSKRRARRDNGLKQHRHLHREKKMKTIQQLTNALVVKFASVKFTGCTRRNKRPSDGYSVPGKSKWTNAVKNAGLPWNHFWSGYAPTPSTQYPTEIADYLKTIDVD